METTALEARITKLLKRAITITREVAKLAKILGANGVPRVTVKLRKPKTK